MGEKGGEWNFRLQRSHNPHQENRPFNERTKKKTDLITKTLRNDTSNYIRSTRSCGAGDCGWTHEPWSLCLTELGLSLAKLHARGSFPARQYLRKPSFALNVPLFVSTGASPCLLWRGAGGGGSQGGHRKTPNGIPGSLWIWARASALGPARSLQLGFNVWMHFVHREKVQGNKLKQQQHFNFDKGCLVR